MVADAVERLGAQVQIGERNVGAPHGMVVPLGQVRREGVLARMATGAVPAIVTERDGFDEGGVEPQRARDAAGHLCHLERVGEARALMIGREDEHLRLPRETAEGRGVKDAVTVAFEAGADRIGRLGDPAITSAVGQGCPRGQRGGLGTFASGAVEQGQRRRCRRRRIVRGADGWRARVTGHRCRPGSGSIAEVVHDDNAKDVIPTMHGRCAARCH
ncbi:unannotated protein [freshwater metagenome]|uniref:Unannotated protein n=1 Tax=freshwater metagenome TaxID=449393 RepID=A0A6J7PNR9_9ZZZZ